MALVTAQSEYSEGFDTTLVFALVTLAGGTAAVGDVSWVELEDDVPELDLGQYYKVASVDVRMTSGMQQRGTAILGATLTFQASFRDASRQLVTPQAVGWQVLSDRNYCYAQGDLEPGERVIVTLPPQLVSANYIADYEHRTLVVTALHSFGQLTVGTCDFIVRRVTRQ